MSWAGSRVTGAGPDQRACARSGEAALERVGGKTGPGQGGAADRDRARSLAAGAIGQDRFGAAHAEGRAMNQMEATAVAVSLAGSDATVRPRR
ncbi:MAG: hypothetical protein ACLQFR_00025 [Streptosporangiaceae bacterium]